MNIQEEYINNNNRAIVTGTWYSEELLQLNPDYIFVFGDNEQRQGKGGQAIIRSEPNAFGVATKRKPLRSEDAYMKDCSQDRLVVMNDLNELHKLYRSGKTIVFPLAGLGSGLAELPERAPQIFADINNFIRCTFLTGEETDEGEET